ncbi:hypothetical protein L202_00912 [Cryptococcus amylolentus CBS 6039]|uniref:Uncharacterized protein n=2 Tax=Cryptococcus amylolentus TaxID=104669 RepID=A0A1E3I9L0_9TREE|nr:hypothetical protein L202_00912 [Cryptococcus amylolentus CBS 6039]ODN85085.1 hypothetical protein L202_00912 [Cryptococcus amylolentus CBS 6039]ODO11241.1 hypothetical protein I350_00016 [Cryptococcus amylolentus CBS 6273]
MSDNRSRISTRSANTVEKSVVIDTTLEENQDIDSAVSRITSADQDFITAEDVEVRVTRKAGTDYVTVHYPVRRVIEEE